MTIESLLDLPLEGLEALSDEQLHTYLSPYFQFTRPASPITAVAGKGTMLLPGAGQSRVTAAPRSNEKATATARAKLMLEMIMKSDTPVTSDRVRAMKELL